VTPGEPFAERSLESKPSTAPYIGLPAAIAAAQRELGRAEEPTSIDLPSAHDPKATYGIWFADGMTAAAAAVYITLAIALRRPDFGASSSPRSRSS
jgi:hypothetical protein